MAQWLTFENYKPKEGQKTGFCIVRSKDSGATLGLIKWYGPWRKFAFYPVADTVFERDCLIDIANKTEEMMKERKNHGKMEG